MNLKEAFRYQNKLQALMDEAQGILSCDTNVTKVENTYLRRKVMPEAQDETVLIASETEYYEQITGVAQFLLYLLEEKGKLFAAIRKAMVKSFIIGHLRSFPARKVRGLSRCRRSARDKWLKLHRTLAAPQTASHKMRRAAGLSLLLSGDMQFCRDGNQDLFHRNLKKRSKRVKVVYRGKTFALLPLVDGSGPLKAEIALEIPDSQPALQAQAPDVISRGGKVDDGNGFHGHGSRLLQKSSILK